MKEETLKMWVENCDLRAVLQSCNDLNLHNCNFGNFYVYNCMCSSLNLNIWFSVDQCDMQHINDYTQRQQCQMCVLINNNIDLIIYVISKNLSFPLIETNLKSRIWNFRWLRYAATMSNVCAYQQEEFLRPQPDTLSDLTPKPWAHQHVHISMNTHQNMAIKTVTPPTNTQL